MTKKTKARAAVREGVAQTEAARGGLAYLIEDSFERFDVVYAARGISDQLAKIAQNIEKMVADDVMPLVTTIGDKLGAEAAKKFGDALTQKVRDASAAVQSANTGLQADIDNLEHAIQGGDISDMGMNDGSMGAEPAGGDMGAVPPEAAAGAGAPPAPQQAGGLSDLPPPDAEGNAEDDALVGGSFAGRPAKESARRRGTMIKEAPFAGVGGERFTPDARRTFPTDAYNAWGAQGEKPFKPANPRGDAPRTQPAIDEHPFRSTSHEANVNNLALFHGGAAKLAKNIDNMVETESLTGEQRKALANVLSHMASIASNADHWAAVDPDEKLTLALKGAGIWNPQESPAVAKIVGQLKRLAHILSAKHDDLLHENIQRLRRAKNPDAMVFETFRKKLVESRDAQLAAISTARSYAIDVEDVVSAVREGAKRQPLRLREFKAKMNPAKRGMFKGNNLKDIEHKLAGEHERAAAAEKKGEKVPADVKKAEHRLNFAKRAKQHWTESRELPKRRSRMTEDDLPNGVPMFPVEQGSPVQAGQAAIPANTNPAQPTTMTPPNEIEQPQPQQVGKPNYSSNKPMTPSQLRTARVQTGSGSTDAGRPQPSDQGVDGYVSQQPDSVQNAQGNQYVQHDQQYEKGQQRKGMQPQQQMQPQQMPRQARR